MKKSFVFVIIFFFLLTGCNSDLSEEEKKALWDNAQTQGEIIRRSGTPFNLATDKDLALADAENRLRTGGGMLGKKANFSFLGEDGGASNQITSLGMPINPYLWRASLNTIDFMPLSSVNYSGGIIITDWYSDGSNPNESIKISIRFLTNEIRSDSVQIKVFKRECFDGLKNSVTEEIDGGPILVQKSCTVDQNDNIETLKQKVQALEGKAFIEAINLITNK